MGKSRVVREPPPFGAAPAVWAAWRERHPARTYYPGKIPQRHLPDLVATMDAAYAQAVKSGLGRYPSGPGVASLDVHAAACLVADSCTRGSYPAAYGGTMNHHCGQCHREFEVWWNKTCGPEAMSPDLLKATSETIQRVLDRCERERMRWWSKREHGRCGHYRWSAPRVAALAVYTRALALGLTPAGAARAVGVARHAANRLARGETAQEER